MYATSTVMNAIKFALSDRGFRGDTAASDRNAEAMAIKRMTYTALRLLTPESPTGAAALIGLNATAARTYEEHLNEEHENSFWRSQSEKAEWIADVMRYLRAGHLAEYAKPDTQ